MAGDDGSRGGDESCGQRGVSRCKGLPAMESKRRGQGARRCRKGEVEMILVVKG